MPELTLVICEDNTSEPTFVVNKTIFINIFVLVSEEYLVLDDEAA